MFCAAFSKNSVSLLRFPIFCHVNLLSWEMSLVCHLNIHTVVFLPVFIFKLFLSVGVRVVSVVSGFKKNLCISFSVVLCASLWSSSRCIDASMLFSMLTRALPPCFLDIFTLECKALYLFISFLVLWSICLSFFLVLFKNSLEYYFLSFFGFFFYTSVSWWASTGAWATTNILKSSGLFSVFWLIIAMPKCGWSRLVLQFLTLPNLLPSLWASFRAH